MIDMMRAVGWESYLNTKINISPFSILTVIFSSVDMRHKQHHFIQHIIQHRTLTKY